MDQLSSVHRVLTVPANLPTDVLPCCASCTGETCCAVLCCPSELRFYVPKYPCLPLDGSNVSHDLLLLGYLGTCGEVQCDLCISEC